MNAFYLEEDSWNKKTLVDAEFRHASQVLRLKKNDNFLLFNGEGKEAVCKIIEIQKKSLSFEIIEEKKHQKAKSSVILAAAWTKAARRGFLLEKVVELEASELWIWKSEYSQFPLPEEKSATVQSWFMQLIAGLKQCHNPFLPELRLFSSQEEMVKHAIEHEHFHVLTTDEAPNTLPYTPAYLNQTGTTVLTIGPEGGFSPKEIDYFAQNKAQFFTMGDRVLRYETASILALGLHFWYKTASQDNK